VAGPEPPPSGDPDRPTEPLRPRAPARPPAARPVAEPAVEYPPEYPPEEPWWSSPWAALTTGLLALLIGGVVGYLIGNSGSSTRTVPSGPPVTHTVTSTKTVQHPVTVTSKTVTQAPPNPADEQRRTEAEEKVKKLEKENEELRRGEPGA